MFRVIDDSSMHFDKGDYPDYTVDKKAKKHLLNAGKGPEKISQNKSLSKNQSDSTPNLAGVAATKTNKFPVVESARKAYDRVWE